MKEFSVKQGDAGLTYAIKRQLNTDGANTSALNKLSVWNKILELVDEQNIANKKSGTDSLYEGGNDKTRAGWGNSYQVTVGKIIKFSDEIWNKIKQLAAGNSVEVSSANKNNQMLTENTKEEEKPTFTNNINFTMSNSNKTEAEEVASEFNSAYNSNQSMCIEKINKIENVLKKLTPENVAYFVEKYPNIAQLIDDVDFIGAGFDKNEVYKYIMLPLAKRADALGIQFDGSTAKEDAKNRKSNLNAMDNQISYLKNWIQKKEQANLNNTQKLFNKSNDLLVRVANMDSLNDLDTQWGTEEDKNYKWVNCTLPSGEYIQINYNDNDILEINISNTSKNMNTDISYSVNSATYNIDRLEGKITIEYDFEKFKTIAEEIVKKFEPTEK